MAKLQGVQRGNRHKAKRNLMFADGFPKNSYVALIETRRMIGEEQFQSLRNVISKCCHLMIGFKYGVFEAEFTMYSTQEVQLTLRKHHKQNEESKQYSFSVSAFGLPVRKEEEFFFS